MRESAEQINFQVKKGMKDFYKNAAAERGIGFHEMIREDLTNIFRITL